MNILIFTQNYPRSYDEAIISGMVKNPFNLSLGLKRAGHRVTVITSGKIKGNWSFEGVQVHCIGRGLFKGVVHAMSMELKMFLKFLKLRKKLNPDVVHVQHLNLFFLLLLKKFKKIKCPLIYTAHGTSTPELYASFKGVSLYKILLRINGIIQHLMDSLSWKLADKIISPSEFQVKEMKKLYKVPEEKIKVIYNGVDGKRYFPDPESGKSLRENLNIPETSPVVLYIGRIARKKGVNFLIKSFKKVLKEIPDSKLILVLGNMGRQLDYRREILALINKENLEKNIIKKENVPEKDLPAYYNAADLCVFPSTGYESIPTVIFEAMACGKPVITQGSWGITEVMSPNGLGNILLTEREIESNKLSENISKVIKSKETVKTDSNVLRKFSLENITKDHIKFYARLIQIEGGKNVRKKQK